jgi:hypothetical protein
MRGCRAAWPGSIVHGADVKPFAIAPARHWLLLAHDPRDRARPLDPDELARRPGAAAFLRRFRARLARRSPYVSFRPDDGIWWQVQGAEHMDRGFLVCVSEIAEPPAAAVLRARRDPFLGRVVLPAPDHKVVFHRTDDEDEAHYLAAVINSTETAALLARFANFTAIAPQTIRHLPIPRWDPRDRAHRALAARSRELHEAPSTIGSRLPAIDELVRRLRYSK